MSLDFLYGMLFSLFLTGVHYLVRDRTIRLCQRIAQSETLDKAFPEIAKDDSLRSVSL